MYQKEPSKAYKLLKEAWPYIYRIINGTLYWFINLIKTIIREMINMIKTGGISQ